MKDIIKKKTRLEILFLISFIVFLAPLVLIPISYYFVFLAILGFAGVMYFANSFKFLSNEFKSGYVQAEIVKIIEDAKYEPQRGIPRNEVIHSSVLRKSDRYKSEDYLEGVVLNRKFRSCDLHLQDVRSTGKSATLITIFRGRFFEIEFAKKFEEDVFIYPKQMFKYSLTKGLTKCDVESILFNKNFEVFSKDKTSAFYLLKPNFIDKILEFKKMYPKISFSFKDKRVYVAIDTRRDAFDLIMFKKVDNSFFKEINREIKLIKDIIELIN